MSTTYPSYRTSTNNNIFYRSPKFNIATEPHYKITEYLEEEAVDFPNKKVLNKIITSALNKKKYQGRINLNVPGNKDVITDSDSEEHYVKEDNIKKVNKNMLKQNGCANLIIKKIESQAPQRNEEYYKFTNQKKIYANNDPIYGTRTLTNWNHQIINQEKPLYIQTDQNIYNNDAYYNNTNQIITTTDSNIRTKVKPRIKTDNNYQFNSTVDLRQINYNPRQKPKQVYQMDQSPNQQVDYESSADAEQGSSSYVYYPSKKTNVYRNNKINNIYKENEFSSQSISNNEEPYIKKNIEIKTQKLKGKNNYKIPSNRPTINELINLNYNNKGFSVLQNKFNQKLIKNVVKIQSNWRGYYMREAIYNKMNLIRFIFILFENIKNKYMEHIANIFNEMKYLKVRSEKNENYDDLLKDYNLLCNEYNKLEKELDRIKKIKIPKGNNHFDNLDIVNKENNFEILDIYLDSSKDNIKQEIKEENVKKEIFEPEQKERFNINAIENKEKNIKQEIKEENVKKEIFEPEQKEQFSIINIKNIKNPEKKTKLRAKHKKQNSENKNEKSESEYINHFTSNINISNPSQFMIERNKPIISKESENKPEKKDLLIAENQKEMNIELKLQRKFVDNMISDHNNDINIIQIPIIRQNLPVNKKEINPKFKNDKLIIVKKINLIINKQREKSKEKIINTNYLIEKNNIHIKKIKTKKKDQITEANEEIINNKNNFNNKNEIVKNESLEINPKEMKKIEQKTDIKIKELKPSKAFTEKAKNHMMKMILPIRLKGTLKEYIRKRTFKFLKELKEN